MPTPKPPMTGQEKVARELLDFLRGKGSFEGHWFADGTMPLYWWRKHLDLLDPDTALSSSRTEALEEAEAAALEVARQEGISTGIMAATRNLKEQAR